MIMYKERCDCGELYCSGCNCGMGCAFSPGHIQGTSTLSPLAAIIEATERFLEQETIRSTQAGEPMHLHLPDMRRLRATLTFVKRYQTQCQSVDVGQEPPIPPIYHILY